MFLNVSTFKLNLKRITRTALILIVHRFQKVKRLYAFYLLFTKG